MGQIKAGNTRAGRWQRQPGPEPYHCFLPAPLPPIPPLELTESLQLAQDRATKALARLDGMAGLLPNPGLILYAYIRKEAVLSSQIEGTQSSLSDLLLHESKQAPGVPASDVKEVSNYVAAMEHGLKRLKGGFPLSLRLIGEIHAMLMKGARGGDKQPGEFRASQNWVGGTRPGNAVYVPPPPTRYCPRWVRWKNLSMASRSRRPRSSKRAWLTPNSRAFTPSSTATAASDVS